jgi:DNA-binding transcriptional LysR family regulator
MLMVSPKHPLAKHPAVTVDEIAQHPLIFPKTGYTRQLLDKLFRPYRGQLRVVMELPSVGMIKNFVAAGLGATLISASFAQAEARAGHAVLIPLKEVELWRELGLIYRKDRSLPRAAQAFISIVRQRTAAAARAG